MALISLFCCQPPFDRCLYCCPAIWDIRFIQFCCIACLNTSCLAPAWTPAEPAMAFRHVNWIDKARYKMYFYRPGIPTDLSTSGYRRAHANWRGRQQMKIYHMPKAKNMNRLNVRRSLIECGWHILAAKMDKEHCLANQKVYAESLSNYDTMDAK